MNRGARLAPRLTRVAGVESVQDVVGGAGIGHGNVLGEVLLAAVLDHHVGRHRTGGQARRVRQDDLDVSGSPLRYRTPGAYGVPSAHNSCSTSEPGSICVRSTATNSTPPVEAVSIWSGHRPADRIPYDSAQ